MFIILLCFSFQRCGYARHMVNPNSMLQYFTSWGDLQSWGHAEIDLNQLSGICSFDGRELHEAKVFQWKWPTQYEYGKRVIRIMTKEYNKDGKFINQFLSATGFLVGKENGYFITTRHALRLDRDYSNTEVAIDIMAEAKSAEEECDVVPFGCSGYFNKNGIQYVVGGEDWVIYRLTGTDRTKFVTIGGGEGLKLSPHLQKRMTPIYSLHHIEGVGKKATIRAVSTEVNRPAHIRRNNKWMTKPNGKSAIYYLSWMDIGNGGSGAPLLTIDTNEVVGIHKGTTAIGGNIVCSYDNDRGPVAIRTIDIYGSFLRLDVSRREGLTDTAIDTIRREIFVKPHGTIQRLEGKTKESMDCARILNLPVVFLHNI